MKASDLIKKSISTTRTAVPAPARVELLALCEHNDSCGSNYGRVAAARAIELLQSYGVKIAGRHLLDRICREHLNRKSYGTK